MLDHGQIYHRYDHTVHDGKGLGRNLWLDARSLNYMVERSAEAMSAKLANQHWERMIPIMDQGQLGSCFPPGTRVRMADGSERPIEAVRLLDELVTAEGRTGRVMRTMARDETTGLVRLILWGHSHLRMTREHPVLTARGYVPAAALRIGDEVALPRYTAERIDTICVSDFIPNKSHRLVRGNQWSGIPGRKGLRVGANELPDKISLTPRTGRILGLFLAEGSCDASKARWTFGSHEGDTLVPELAGLLEEEWQVTPHVAPRPNNSINVTLHGTAWARLLSELCGNGAGLKRPHASLLAGPVEFLEALLDGWLAGDGHIRVRNGAVQGAEGITISDDLALAMYDIAQAVGRHPVIAWSLPVMNSAAKTRLPRWTITMASGAGRCRQTDAHVWRKVRELRIEDYVGPVYNLSVEHDESYVAEGIGVHNCTGNAGTGALGTQPYFDRVGSKAFGSSAGDPNADEKFAVALYSDATAVDPYPGNYPPTDTGSSGLAICQVLKSRGTISGYRWASTAVGFVTLLQTAPVMMGTPWYQAFFDPDKNGFIDSNRYWRSSGIAGGHEIEALAVDIDTSNLLNSVITFANSWGTRWADNGYFRMRLRTYTQMSGVDLKQFVV